MRWIFLVYHPEITFPHDVFPGLDAVVRCAAETWLDTAAGNHRSDLASALPDHHQLWVCLDPGGAEKRDLANGTAVCDLPDCQSVV